MNDRTFFIEIMLQWIRDMLLVKGEREKLQGVFILEEAHHVLNREKSRKIGSETVIDLIFREIRELGMGIIYIDQHPSLVSYPALGNTSTQIYMNLGLDTRHSSDIDDAASMLGLDEEQRYYLRKLPVGHGFILCRRLGFTDPFLLEFEKFAMQKGSIRDADIRQVMKDRISFDERPAQEREKYETIKKEMAGYTGEQLDENGWKILNTIMEGRGSFSSQIYKEVKMSGSLFNKRAGKLLDMELLGMATGKVERNKMNYFFPTAMGMTVYEKKKGPFEQAGTANLDEIRYLFEASGWRMDEKEQRLLFDREGRTFAIKILSSANRKAIAEYVGSYHYFLCANEAVQNIVLQEAARAAQQARKRVIAVVATVKDVEKHNTFTKIEFSSL
jgi:hypothetical protein